MRKHSARKWLHFVLDLLPILVLPIFAIYEINHDQNTPIEVEVSENKIVNFNQLASSTGEGTFSSVYSNYYFEYTSDNFNSNNQRLGIYVPLSAGDVYYLRITDEIKINSQGYFLFYNSGTNYQQIPDDGRVFTSLVNGNFPLSRSFNGTADTQTRYYECYVGFINLTEMFGRGNEPTKEQFDSWYTANFYEYTTGRTELLTGYNYITETNTDIGSQMMYALYKPVKEYFNFNNVFNFGDIYHWFELNMFGGNAPMPIFIVWNIIVYQFLMDLIFLVYSIFMFIIDFSTEVLGRAFDFSRHGGSR